MGTMTIGEFARRSNLSAKALRLYDETGLLVPARTDAATGYRFYESDQLERARLVGALRKLDIPLAQIRDILDLDAADAARRISDYWAAAESGHETRRALARLLVNSLTGGRTVMYEVDTREIPTRQVLSLKRHVEGQAGAWAFGKEFVGMIRGRGLPQLEGRAGAMFCIFWGEVNDDSDGPLEFCWPLPDDQADAVAPNFPELTLRTEAAHREAYVDVGPGGNLDPAQWTLVSESLRAWAAERQMTANALGLRVTYLATPPRTGESAPDCDFAVPFD